MTLRTLMLGAFVLLTGCASQAPAPKQPANVSLEVDPGDPQHCSERAECTTKVSRTLLFVFDYAAAGGHLLQRQGRLLFTPDEAAPSEWPALAIRLAEPVDSRFDFAAECRVAQCRYSADELLRVYRSYLADRPCSLQLASAVHGCAP